LDELGFLAVSFNATADALEQAVATLRLAITEREGAEAVKEQTLALVRATLDSTADGMLVVDQSGRPTMWNRKFAGMWGAPETGLASLDVSDLIARVRSQLRNPAAFLQRLRELPAHPDVELHDTLMFVDG